MTDKIFEQKLKGFDYSVFSKVRNSLLDELLQKQRRDNLMNFKSLSQRLSEEMMTDNELDMVAAAGTTLQSAEKDFSQTVNYPQKKQN